MITGKNIDPNWNISIRLLGDENEIDLFLILHDDRGGFLYSLQFFELIAMNQINLSLSESKRSSSKIKKLKKNLFWDSLGQEHFTLIDDEFDFFRIINGKHKINIISSGARIEKDEVLYYHRNSLVKAFKDPIEIFRASLANKVKRITIPFPEYKFVFPDIPSVEYHAIENWIIMSFRNSRELKPDKVFVRIKDIVEIRVSDYSTEVLGSGFDKSQIEYSINILQGSNGFYSKNSDPNSSAQNFLNENLNHYIIPLFNQEGTYEHPYNWIEIIAGEAELINHNLWG